MLVVQTTSATGPRVFLAQSSGGAELTSSAARTRRDRAGTVSGLCITHKCPSASRAAKQVRAALLGLVSQIANGRSFVAAAFVAKHQFAQGRVEPALPREGSDAVDDRGMSAADEHHKHDPLARALPLIRQPVLTAA
jgi:hypothetical protein